MGTGRAERGGLLKDERICQIAISIEVYISGTWKGRPIIFFHDHEARVESGLSRLFLLVSAPRKGSMTLRTIITLKKKVYLRPQRDIVLLYIFPAPRSPLLRAPPLRSCPVEQPKQS